MDTEQPIELVRSADGVAVLTLANPPLNLTTQNTIHALQHHCDDLAADDSVRVVVLTGSGQRAFCAGSDIRELAEARDSVAAKRLASENRALGSLARLPQPVIAAINGVALGGGAELAIACDLRVIDQTAVIGFPEVKLGVFPGSGGVYRLPRLVGPANALRLLYTGDPISAEDAYRIGLVDQVASVGEALGSALSLARELASRPSLALALIKRGVYDSLENTMDQAIVRTLDDSDAVFTGPDIDEGVRAFFEKRPPTFTAGRSSMARDLGDDS